MSNFKFDKTFAALTGNSPFPWQRALYDEWFCQGRFPQSCNLPTGLGKTSVIAVWLIALVNAPTKMPRRLVYVVNRRTVVDQTTDEVKTYRDKLLTPEKFEHSELLGKLRDALEELCALELNEGDSPLAISTLRGQFADNREWSADPCRPAVICGTVDMIGSRLLFSGYGLGFKSRPLHAGFLGQDALLVHDEAHLEPAFQRLIESIEAEQERCKEFVRFHVMELTATSRGGGNTFTLTDDDKKNDMVHQRIHAPKKLLLEPLKDPKKLADQIAEKSLKFKDSGLAILVFVRTVEDVLKVREALTKAKQPVETLTGTLRGKERDDLVTKPIFQRFLPKPPDKAAPGTVYLVCTSAGEVGVNITADHLICDLSTFESMAQRFGRVNRFGHRTDTEIHVIHSTEHKNADYQQRLERTLELLRKLNDVSADALGELPPAERQAAFAPTPAILPTSDILFDAWSLTSIEGKLPGRPPVEAYLHGLPTEWQPSETQVAWREEVDKITGDWLAEYDRAELLSEYPLKPHELLHEPSYRAFDCFTKMAKRLEGRTVPVWLLNDDGSVTVLTLAELADKGDKERSYGKTVIFPPSAGGLAGGMLDGNAEAPTEGSLDVANEWFIDGIRQRKRVWNNATDTETEALHEVIAVRFPSEDDEEEEVWRWYRIENEGDRVTKRPVEWRVHVGDVERVTSKIVDALPLPEDLKQAVKLAAKYHDHGKRRQRFQLVLGNTEYPRRVLAKSGSSQGGKFQETYRHEFGSLFDIEKELGEVPDLVLHLIATHHGRARPHFPAKDVFDPDYSHVEAERIATEVPRRFARLQRKYGRWGLAYLESLLRAADWAASSHPSEFWQEGQS